MKEQLTQPAATIAAVLLQRLAQKGEVPEADITSAFLLAYRSLERAEKEVHQDLSGAPTPPLRE